MMDKIAKQQATKKIKGKVWIIGIVSLVLLLMEMTTPRTALGWNGDTHRFLTNQGILILEKSYATDVQYLHDPIVLGQGTTNAANIIIYYSPEPDVSENDGGLIGGWKGHFYDPRTGLNYRGESDPTANTRLRDHYGNAVQAYKAGNVVRAWTELGKAIHYLQDLNVPHHAANIPNFDNKATTWSIAHTEFEGWVDNNRSAYALQTEAPEELYNYALNNNVWQIGHDRAIEALGVVGYVDTWEKVQIDLNNVAAAKPTLESSQKITAAILHKFLTEINYTFP